MPSRCAVATTPGAEAVPLLAQCGQGDVVLDRERDREPLGEPADNAGPVPAGQVGREPQAAAAHVVHAGGAEDDVRDLATGRGGEVVDDPAEPADQRGRAPRMGRHVLAYGDLTAQVDQRGADPLASDIEADHPAGLGPDLVQQSGTSGVSGAMANGNDQPGALQVGECERDGRLGQSGRGGELRPRHGPEHADPLVHGPFVHDPQHARGVRGGVHTPRPTKFGRHVSPLTPISQAGISRNGLACAY
jgi:hypothetical protein